MTFPRGLVFAYSKNYFSTVKKYTFTQLAFGSYLIYVPDQVVTLAQDGTSPNMGWPNKELTTLSLLRPKIPKLGWARY